MQGILLDSDYIIALTFDNESTHHSAALIRENIAGIEQFILEPILYELATVTSRKFGQEHASKLIKQIYKLPIRRIIIDELEPHILELFHSQRKKSTSLFDCANLVTAKHYGFKIASFDSFYPKELLVNAAAH